MNGPTLNELAARRQKSTLSVATAEVWTSTQEAGAGFRPDPDMGR